MTAPLFTVLLPVHRPQDLLPYAAASVLAQSVAALELFIVCDGAPAETVAAAEALAAADRRVRVFAFPKGERHGEGWRALALEQASGRYVCQIADDDLWFDDHLAQAERLMGVADFGNLLGVQLRPDGTSYVKLADLASPVVRQSMLQNPYNLFGPTCAAYSMEAYRALPVGWSPAPAGIWTDLWMWRKFLSCPGLRFATWPVATSLGFPAAIRAELDLGQRRREIERHAGRLGDAGFRDELWRRAMLDLAGRLVGLQLQVNVRARDGEAMAAALGQIAAADGDSARQTELACAALARR